MGLYSFCLAGGGLVLIGAWEALVSSYAHLNPASLSLSSTTTTTKTRVRRRNPFLSYVTFIAISLLSFVFIIDTLISSIDALQTNDRVGFVLQLEILSISSLFLLSSIVSLLINFTNLIPLPSSIPNLIDLFAFGEEFLFFYLQRKDPTGIENRYFDMLLVPISICIFSTILEFCYPKSNLPTWVRGIGLILQGTGIIQMDFSFFTDLMAHGCNLHEKSRGNFTVKCRGHPEYQRSKAIATLQFNCHLAFLVLLIVGFYSFFGSTSGVGGDYMNYKPLNAELHQLANQNQFTLNSEEEDAAADDDGEIAVEENLPKPKSVVNGLDTH